MIGRVGTCWTYIYALLKVQVICAVHYSFAVRPNQNIIGNAASTVELRGAEASETVGVAGLAQGGKLVIVVAICAGACAAKELSVRIQHTRSASSGRP